MLTKTPMRYVEYYIGYSIQSSLQICKYLKKIIFRRFLKIGTHELKNLSCTVAIASVVRGNNIIGEGFHVINNRFSEPDVLPSVPHLCFVL